MDKEEDAIDVIVKLVLCGDAGVGKTNLLSRYLHNSFDLNSRASIGVDFYSKTVESNSRKVNVQLFDTAGQDKYRSICGSYLKRCDGIILVYDITSAESFAKLQIWKNQIFDTVPKNVPILLVGNKVDLKSLRRIPTDEGFTFSQKHKFFFMETSALTNEENCVLNAFELIIEEMCKSKKDEMDKLENDLKNIEKDSLRLVVSSMQPQNPTKRCC